MGFFEHVEVAPPDAIFGLSAAFLADPRKHKVNLMTGVFKTSALVTPVLDVVKEAERLLVEQEKSKDYLPIQGDKGYLGAIGPLFFGASLWKKGAQKIAGAQTLGGTGALRVGGDFLKKWIGEGLSYSDPTWPNHGNIFRASGLKIDTHPYYDRKGHRVDFERMKQHIAKLPAQTTVLLQACCHNPTGVDLSLDQWKELSRLMKERKLAAFFDCAYLGFDRGIEEDARVVQLFAEEGHELLVACSFSKNFGLYAERTGALFILTSSEDQAERVTSQLKALIRANYSNPPLHGAKIVEKVLTTPELRQRWIREVSGMRQRIHDMRHALADTLNAKTAGTSYSYFKESRGMFSFCDLNKAQVERLIAEYGIYMTGDGRINVAGLNAQNLDYIASAITSL